MLEVKVENIIPVTEARDKFNQLIDGVEGSDDLFVMTKNGKPSAILVGVHHLEKLTGDNHKNLAGKTDANTETPPAPTTPPPATDKPAETTEPKTVDDKITFDNVTTDMISKEEEKDTTPATTPSPARTTSADSAVSTPPSAMPSPSPTPSANNVFSMPDIGANSGPTPPSPDPLAPPTQNPAPGTPTPTPDVVDSAPPAGQI